MKAADLDVKYAESFNHAPSNNPRAELISEKICGATAGQRGHSFVPPKPRPSPQRAGVDSRLLHRIWRDGKDDSIQRKKRSNPK